MRARHLLLLVPLAALLLAVAAYAAADLARGQAALKEAYQHTEGDEGGFEGELVEQCAVESETVVRCVIVEASGHAIDFPSGNYAETRRPKDHGVATFGPDDQITTSREPFAEAPVELDADIRVRDRFRWRRVRRLLVSVAPDVPSSVSVRGWFGRRAIRNRPATPLRTVDVPAARTPVALKLNSAQRKRIRKALRREGRIPALILVRVEGDVGPANATELRLATGRVVR